MHDWPEEIVKIRNFLKKVQPQPNDENWLIIGLGNPGEKYSNTRHNAGARAISHFAKQEKVTLKSSGKLLRLGSTSINNLTVNLVKPRSYVNTSGKAARSAIDKTASPINQTLVIFDDLDLPVGSLRLRIGGGSGGHNGIKSLIEEIGPDFIRLRIGIGRPLKNGQPSYDPEIVADYVLTAEENTQAKILSDAIKQTSDVIRVILNDGINIAAGKFNG